LICAVLLALHERTEHLEHPGKIRARLALGKPPEDPLRGQCAGTLCVSQRTRLHARYVRSAASLALAFPLALALALALGVGLALSTVKKKKKKSPNTKIQCQ
jgi:hypothetical protein